MTLKHFFFGSFFLLFPVLQTASLSNPKPFSSKPPMTLLFKTHNPKKEKRISHISLSFTLGVCVCVCFLSYFLIYDSLSLSLSGQNKERDCDDGFVDVKSVEVSSISEKGPRLSKSGSYIGSWEVSEIIDRRIKS